MSGAGGTNLMLFANESDIIARLGVSGGFPDFLPLASPCLDHCGEENHF